MGQKKPFKSTKQTENVLFFRFRSPNWKENDWNYTWQRIQSCSTIKLCLLLMDAAQLKPSCSILNAISTHCTWTCLMSELKLLRYPTLNACYTYDHSLATADYVFSSHPLKSSCRVGVLLGKPWEIGSIENWQKSAAAFPQTSFNPLSKLSSIKLMDDFQFWLVAMLKWIFLRAQVWIGANKFSANTLRQVNLFVTNRLVLWCEKAFRNDAQTIWYVCVRARGVSDYQYCSNWQWSMERSGSTPINAHGCGFWGR